MLPKHRERCSGALTLSVVIMKRIIVRFLTYCKDMQKLCVPAGNYSSFISIGYQGMPRHGRGYCSIFSTFGDETFSMAGGVAGFDAVFAGAFTVGSAAGVGSGTVGSASALLSFASLRCVSDLF